jgi:hypothetical protein
LIDTWFLPQGEFLFMRVVIGASVFAAAVLFGGASHSFGVGISVATVGTYAPNPTPLTINDAASNTITNGLTLANFRTLITSAFAANTGGVIDDEDQSAGGTITGKWRNNGTTYGDGSANAISVSYGIAQTNTLNLYRSDLDATGAPVGINANSNNGTNVVSGTSYLGIPANASPINLVFGKGLSALGLTEVPRGALRVDTMTAILDNAGTLVGSTETITANNTPGAIFWGFQAPTGRSIVGLNIVSTDGSAIQFSRYDDLGFVVAVPEPSSGVLIGLGSLGMGLFFSRSRYINLAAI